MMKMFPSNVIHARNDWRIVLRNYKIHSILVFAF